MRQSKTKKQKSRAKTKRLAIEGRTKVQREKNVMRSAINNYDGNLGELKGVTTKERYVHMNALINAENARLKAIAKQKEKLENVN
tara:strand:- start:1294 stop:1548 length:255 start_codon:yes stop_codon:yes gene_type:complete